MVEEYIHTLKETFSAHSNPVIAKGQKAYLKDQFEFFGIKTPLRKEIQKPFLDKEHLPSKKDAESIVRICWQSEEREFQMFAQELWAKYKRNIEAKDIALLEWMITHKSWWDSVDFIATHLVGAYFLKFPEEKMKFVSKWCKSDHLWLRRTAIIFQLKYKKNVDLEVLTFAIEKNIGTKEFFLNKAIGWSLRDYSRVDSSWVLDFVEAHPALSNLSIREATRLIK